jgi:hypothetical protein
MNRKADFGIFTALIVFAFLMSWTIFQFAIGAMAKEFILSVYNTLGHMIGLAMAIMLLVSFWKK